MKPRLWMCLAVVLLFSFGCGSKPSVLEGKIVDDKGAAVANVKVTAKQVRVVEKQERYETLDATTKADGTFKFEDIFPLADYVLTFSAPQWKPDQVLNISYKPKNLQCYYSQKDGWLSNDKIMVKTEQAGKMMKMPDNLVIYPKQ